MTQNELIRQQINDNNKIITSLITPNQFVLNNTIANLLKENHKLQSQCTHEFEKGYCKWCDLEDLEELLNDN